MELDFKCAICNKIFKSEAIKKEWNDPIYGNSWIYIAFCPLCENESAEYKKPSQKKPYAIAPSTSSHSCSGCCCKG